MSKLEDDILQSAVRKLLPKKNVVAVGIGYKEVDGKKTKEKAIICSVSKKEPLNNLKRKDAIPAQVKTMSTDVKEIGEVKALLGRKDRWRPASGGVSVGHEQITAGTFGCLVKKNNNIYILSNNHVLADNNDAQLGSAILQPGKADGGEYPGSKIATLAEFVHIQFPNSDENGKCKIGSSVAKASNFIAKILGSKTRLQSFSAQEAENRVDAAIALPVDDSWVIDDILEFGAIVGLAKAELGMKVKKSGRTTEVTHGEITQTNVTVSVRYGNGKLAQFVDQLMIEPGGFSSGGDSGSVVLDEDNNLVALLFAGSGESTFVSPIEFVFAELGIEL